MRATPDVSIIIVNWNRQDDVLKILHYLRFQRDVRFEVVVVDNGSTDGSAEKLARVDGIKFVSLQANLGPCVARNVGIELALGRYILFLDSDSILSKWKLGRLVERWTAIQRLEFSPCVSLTVLPVRSISGFTASRSQPVSIHANSRHTPPFRRLGPSFAAGSSPRRRCVLGPSSSSTTKKSTCRSVSSAQAIGLSTIPRCALTTALPSRAAIPRAPTGGCKSATGYGSTIDTILQFSAWSIFYFIYYYILLNQPIIIILERASRASSRDCRKPRSLSDFRTS